MLLSTPNLWVLLVLSSTVLAAPITRDTKPATGCTAAREAYLAKNGDDLVAAVKPSVVFSCLESVPVDVERDVNLVDYLLPYAQFQRTLGYLKAPPKEYLLPGADTLGGLVQIQEKFREDGYSSQFEFTKDVSRVYSAAHDSHFNYLPALLRAFRLVRTFQLVSVSVDGTDLPKVYVNSDILFQPNASSKVSPIEFINDIPTDDFLAQEAHTQFLQDPYAQYNSLF